MSLFDLLRAWLAQPTVFIQPTSVQCSHTDIERPTGFFKHLFCTAKALESVHSQLHRFPCPRCIETGNIAIGEESAHFQLQSIHLGKCRLRPGASVIFIFVRNVQLVDGGHCLVRKMMRIGNRLRGDIHYLIALSLPHGPTSSSAACRICFSKSDRETKPTNSTEGRNSITSTVPSSVL